MSEYQYTDLETQVLKLLLDGDDIVLKSLREQLSSAMIESRVNTGVGFYINFQIAHGIRGLSEFLPVKPNFCFGDVEAMIDPLKHGAGFLLWIKSGFLKFLEGYTFDEKWPSLISGFKLNYISGERDLVELRELWKI